MPPVKCHYVDLFEWFIYTTYSIASHKVDKINYLKLFITKVQKQTLDNDNGSLKTIKLR